MSLLNVSLTPERVVIATDTAQVGGAVAGRKVSKCFALPHLPLALALRGNLYFGASLWGGFLYVSPCAEEIFDNAQSIVAQSFVQLRRQELSAPALGDRQQVVMAAFDERAARMRAVLLEQTDPAFGFQRTEIETTFFAPADADWFKPPADPHSAAGMLGAAHQQMAWSRTNAPGTIGGELIVTTLDRLSVKQERAFDLEREI